MNLEAAMALFTVCPNKGKPISVPAGISVYCPILFWLKKENSASHKETFSFIYGCVHMCVFVCAVCEHVWSIHVGVQMCVYMCTHACGGQRSKSCVLLYYFWTLSTQVLSLNMGPLARLAEQQALGILLSLAPSHPNTRLQVLTTRLLTQRSLLRSSSLHSRRPVLGAIAPAPAGLFR